MPQPPPQPRPSVDMQAVVKRISEAIEKMTWTVTPVKPDNIQASYDGALDVPYGGTDPSLPSGLRREWAMTVCVFVVDGRVGMDGAATKFNEGLICRLTPAQAERAVQLAERAVEAAAAGS